MKRRPRGTAVVCLGRGTPPPSYHARSVGGEPPRVLRRLWCVPDFVEADNWTHAAVGSPRRISYSTGVGPLLVVLRQPVVRDFLHLLDRFEDVGIQHLGSVGLVEALDEGVLVGLARCDEAQVDLSILGPIDEGVGGQLAAVVQAQRGGLPVQFDQLIHDPDGPLARDRGGDLDPERQACCRRARSACGNAGRRRAHRA